MDEYRQNTTDLRRYEWLCNWCGAKGSFLTEPWSLFDVLFDEAEKGHGEACAKFSPSMWLVEGYRAHVQDPRDASERTDTPTH